MDDRQQRLFESTPPPWELDDAEDRLRVQVAFADPPFGPFDYLVPSELRDQVTAGSRVVVPLGRSNRAVTGYCVSVEPLGEGNPGGTGHRLKEVRRLIDRRPLVSASMLELTRWMSEYYICPWGQVLDGIIPAGVRGRAGTRQVSLLQVPTSVAAKLTQLQLPKKQAHALRTLIQSPTPMTVAQLAAAAGCTEGPIRALVDKQLVTSALQRVQWLDFEQAPEVQADAPKLNADQQAALEAIRAALDSRQQRTILMHGVTGSGKTEVYIRAIQEVLSYGRQAIVLVPEISLTPQTVARFRSRFERVAVLHSHLSPSERHWHWTQIARGEVSVVVGARSAVFAPTPLLGLIVIDEEHDASFKQDTAPRYHARDVALQRAQSEQIPVVLGSATPSLESWAAARTGRFEIVELPERVLSRPLPYVSVIDLRDERTGRSALSRPLQNAMKDALRDGGQVILLLNRRGYSTVIQCHACGNVVQCPECAIALTHHREGEKAICHYCDYAADAPARCPECGFEGIWYGGFGTQRLEVEINAKFKKAGCLRMDTDTMRKPGSHEEALERFRSGEFGILLGTQMIAKGLDFPNVTLVGVVNADTALHFPDYRASERTFQLVTQVAGRAGRGPKGGRVLVQTHSPEHPAIVSAQKHDYHTFADAELAQRQQHGYPPTSAMIRIIMRGPSESEVQSTAADLLEKLQRANSDDPAIRILGPAPAPISKLRGKYRFHYVMMGPLHDRLRVTARLATSALKCPSDVQWVIDVDPWDML